MCRLWAVDLKWESAATKAKVEKKVKAVEQVDQKGPFKADWDSLKQYQNPDWYQDAKFGIFMHWGLYSVPGYANEWYSRNMYQKDITWDDAFKHHVVTYGPQDKFGYKDFIPLFKAEKFDPDHWAKLFKAAGAKYVVPVAEHHDGFAMYDSDFSRWTAKKMGPKRDLIGELAKAIRKEGLIFGLSSHRAEHWWFMSGGTKFPSDVQDPKYADFYGPAREDYSNPDEAWTRNWLARSTELVDKYKPQIVYFDWWIGEVPAFKPYIPKFAAYYYDRAKQWKQGVVLNLKDKAFVPGTAVQDVEKGKLPGINPVAWQTDTSVSWKSWAYLKDDSLKDAGYLVRSLIDTVSKNGNLLLDIGPAPDGTIPEAQEKVLLGIGDWLKVNGEAIYGTRPWIVYGEGPTKDAGGKFSEADMKYQEGDVRFTRKGNVLYVLCLKNPTHEMKVAALGRKTAPGVEITEVSILGDDGKVKWERHDDGLSLDAPASSGDMPVVYRLTLKGSMAGNLTVLPLRSGFTIRSQFQNYDDRELDLAAALWVGKDRSTRPVTVAAFSSEAFQADVPVTQAGLYPISLEVPGQPSLTGQGLFPYLDLSGDWLFQEGDDVSWSKPDLDDSGWQKVQLPAHWEDHSNYTADNVFGWYRKKVFIPAEWKGHDLRFPLGKIDDTDASYLNGVKIGQTGEFPPHFQGFWDKPRLYDVPAGVVKFGQENVIAIRVFDASGGGGLYDGPLAPVEVK